VGPTGGYLVGFVLAQPVLGCLTRTGATGSRPSFARLLVALLAGKAVIFASGLAWLQVWVGGGLAPTLALGLWPFLPGLFLKVGMALAAAPLLLPRFRQRIEST
jgi:biotin transport system substrate-specific component